jgi:30S ribosomal protein S31
MGKGDKKTKRGKIFMGSYGVRRPRNKKNTTAPVVEVAPAPVEAKEAKKVKEVKTPKEVKEVKIPKEVKEVKKAKKETKK